MSFFNAFEVANLDDRKGRMTIRHLLTMTSGLDWNEDLPYADPKNSSVAMEAAFDWAKFTIDRPMVEEPGRAFEYWTHRRTSPSAWVRSRASSGRYATFLSATAWAWMSTLRRFLAAPKGAYSRARAYKRN